MKALVVAAILALARPADAQPSLALERAIEMALTRNERAAIADLEVAVAVADVDKARADLLPRVDLGANGSYRPFGDPKLVGQGDVTLRQALFQPPAYPAVSQAKRSLAARRSQTIDDKRQLAFDAASAFISVLLAEQVAEAAQRKLETAKANLADTEAKVAAQLNSTNDVTRARIDVTSATRDLASRRGDIEAAIAELAFVINEPVGKLARPEALLAAGQQPAGDLAQLVTAGVARRPDILARKHAAKAARDVVRASRATYLPSIDLTAQGSLTTNAGSDDRHYDAIVSVNASWTLWDSGRSADVRQRDAQARIAELEVTQAERAAEQQIRVAAARLAAAQAALAAAREAMEAARKSASETTILYRQGLAKAIELIDANDQRFQAEVNYATTEFSVASAFLDLRQAIGLPPVGDR